MMGGGMAKKTGMKKGTKKTAMRGGGMMKKGMRAGGMAKKKK
jgi:hypothetical protein